MATTNWTGNVDGDLNNASNWDNGIPTADDTAVISGFNYTGVFANPSSGTCIAGTVTLENGEIHEGRIQGGVWSGNITSNYGFFDNGTFNGAINATSNYINGGTFNGAVTVSLVEITNATFNSTVENSGVIVSGTFNGTVTNVNGVGQISGGDYYGIVLNYNTITGGNYYGKVENYYALAWSIIYDQLICSGDGLFYTDFGTINLTNVKRLKIAGCDLTYEKGINGSGILGMI